MGHSFSLINWSLHMIHNDEDKGKIEKTKIRLLLMYDLGWRTIHHQFTLIIMCSSLTRMT